MTFVHANYAVLVADGRLRHDVRASCAADMRRVHTLRETYPGVIVGRRTFETDRPKLTARAEHLGRVPLRQPKRFVFSRTSEFRVASGFNHVLCPDGDLTAAISALGGDGISGALIETGPRLLQACLEQGVLQALTVYARGKDPGDVLAALYPSFPLLPRAVVVDALGEGHLLTFDVLGVNAAQGPNDGYASAPLQSAHGNATLYTFRDGAFGRHHGVLVFGDVSESDGARPPLVRIHSECWTSAQMQSRMCDCQEQLEESHRLIAAEGRGIIVIHNAEGRGIGRMNKTLAYRLQVVDGFDTATANEQLGLPVDAREYFSIALFLRRLGVSRIRLLTGNPEKVTAIGQTGIEVVEAVPLRGFCTKHNHRYMATKVAHGHDPRILEPAGAAL